jgi:rhamnose utilization protein RhaD (predicted bifunctional aldolase and dehydrogenase)
MDRHAVSSKRIAEESLIELSHVLGRDDRGMAILGEGNASAGLKGGRFLVKASGSSLGTLRRHELVECRVKPLMSLLDRKEVTDAEIDRVLMESRVDEKGKKPSVEALFHALLLSLDGIHFVGHTHAVAVNQLLCSRRAEEFAAKRIFPDEVVCCGVASVFVPYTDPGFQLARAIRLRALAFIRVYKTMPRVILLQNHGIITIGKTPAAVLAAMLMAEKAASIWVGAAAIGGPAFLSKHHVARIAGRSDEHYRQRALKL